MLSAGQSNKGLQVVWFYTQYPTPIIKHPYPAFDLNGHSASLESQASMLGHSLLTKLHFTGYINYHALFSIAIK